MSIANLCLLALVLPVHQLYSRHNERSPSIDPCFSNPYSGECLAMIVQKWSVSNETAQALIDRALNLYAGKDEAAIPSIYKPSVLAVACLASLGLVLPGPDSDCVACGPACRVENSLEVCELYCEQGTILHVSTEESMPQISTDSDQTATKTSYYLLCLIGAFLLLTLLLLVAIIFCRYSQFRRQREGNDRPDQERLCSAVGQPIFEQRTNMKINSKNASENLAFNESEGNDREQSDQIPVGQIHDLQRPLMPRPHPPGIPSNEEVEGKIEEYATLVDNDFDNNKSENIVEQQPPRDVTHEHSIVEVSSSAERAMGSTYQQMRIQEHTVGHPFDATIYPVNTSNLRSNGEGSRGGDDANTPARGDSDH